MDCADVCKRYTTQVMPQIDPRKIVSEIHSRTIVSAYGQAGQVQRLRKIVLSIVVFVKQKAKTVPIRGMFVLF